MPLIAAMLPDRVRRFRTACRIAAGLVLAGGVLLAGGMAQAADALPQIHYVAAKFPPYTNDDDGHAAGPTRNLLDMLADRLGQKATVRLLPLARALATAENEPDTLIALIARTPARETQFHWVCPVLDYDVQVFRRRVRSDIAVAGIDDLRRWHVVGANSDVKTVYLQRQGIPVVTTADEDEAMRLLLYDRVDLMPGHPASMHLRLQNLGLPRDTLVPVLALPELTSRLYLAFGRRTEPAVADAVGAACAALIKDGTVARLMIPAMLN